jgi:hypothetical protein
MYGAMAARPSKMYLDFSKNPDMILSMKLTSPVQYKTLYASGVNSLAIVKVHDDKNLVECVTWDTCRETFAFRFNQPTVYKGDTTCFLFKAKNRKNVKNFIAEFEKRLKVKSKSILLDTTKDGIILVQPSKFWLSDKIRMGLLTILLRCGSAYTDESSFDDTIVSYKYGKDTKLAIDRFLQGFTKCKHPLYVSGQNLRTSPWRNIFAGDEGEKKALYLKKR